MITLGCPDVSCECGQTATCKRISVSFLLRRNGKHLFVHCVYGQQDCDHWSIFLCLEEAVVALDDGRAWLVFVIVARGLFFSPTSSDTDAAPRLIRQVSESKMSSLFTGWLIGCRNFDRNW